MVGDKFGNKFADSTVRWDLWIDRDDCYRRFVGSWMFFLNCFYSSYSSWLSGKQFQCFILVLIRSIISLHNLAVYESLDSTRYILCSVGSSPPVLPEAFHQDFCAEVSVEAEEEARILGQLQHPHIVRRLKFFRFRGGLKMILTAPKHTYTNWCPG